MCGIQPGLFPGARPAAQAPAINDQEPIRPRSGAEILAGDSPPVHRDTAMLPPATQALLQPAVYRPPTATFTLPHGDKPDVSANNITPAAFTTVLGRTAGVVLPWILRRLPSPKPAPPLVRPSPPSQPAPEKPPPVIPPILPPAPGSPSPTVTPEPEKPKPQSPEPNEPNKPKPAPGDDVNEEQPNDEESDSVFDELGELVRAYIGRTDNRGTPSTVRGTNAMIDECMKLARKEFRKLADYLEHTGGGNQDGKLKGRYRNEENVDLKGGGYRRPDATFTYKKDDIEVKGHASTISTHVDGTPTGRELRALEDIARTIGDGLIHSLRKLRPGGSEAQYRREARDVCRKVFEGIEKEVERQEREKTKEKGGSRDERDKSKRPNK